MNSPDAATVSWVCQEHEYKPGEGMKAWKLFDCSLLPNWPLRYNEGNSMNLITRVRMIMMVESRREKW